MNLLFGEIAAIFSEDEMLFGKVRVGGALRNVPLSLLPEAACGDRILLCDGVAIGRVRNEPETHPPHVPGNPR